MEASTISQVACVLHRKYMKYLSFAALFRSFFKVEVLPNFGDYRCRFATCECMSKQFECKHWNLWCFNNLHDVVPFPPLLLLVIFVRYILWISALVVVWWASKKRILVWSEKTITGKFYAVLAVKVLQLWYLRHLGTEQL